VEAIFGVDIDDPQVPLARTEFVHADTRHSVIGKLVRELRLDTVIHTAVVVNNPGSARAMHETNVIGTMNVLAACAGESSPVQRLVVKSSVAIYGSEPDDPSFMSEEMAGRGSPRNGLARDLLEMEQMVEDLGIRNPGLTVTVLRLGHKLGIRDRTPLSRYFTLPLIPTIAGFDPRIQLLHEDDAVEAFLRASIAEHPGVFNVSGDGIVLLSQAIRLTGRRTFSLLPPYAASLGRMALKRLGGLDLPAPLYDVLAFGQVVDCSALEREFGWRPGYDTKEVVEDFAGRSAEPVELPVSPPQERELQAYINRRQRGDRQLQINVPRGGNGRSGA
jgi:UDP-glucose 4-epimerase